MWQKSIRPLSHLPFMQTLADQLLGDLADSKYAGVTGMFRVQKVNLTTVKQL